ncbi:pimeloyl-ACP methyl ester carboxylesterase [Natronocella acetinitrilica]|uniref:Pimeloyl-ACP methyl ester carboxylesterase n=1 Tax=Natronocella acetinitrilica TaxID=414046 RepID=A0AAE3KCF7_9GAMM|nr:alpha/beta fold hydrolase [Natronocella acetinitrilica]MCP1675726.1 pimeloyl-ACP methyl ester carboxylesterase [Natronocella acetinitrilica]
MEIQRQFARLSSAIIHYATAGEGTPVVLLHGWPQTHHAWRHVMPLLANDYRVIAPDLRGLGDSSRPLEGYDAASVAADLWELLHEHLGLAEWHLVGHDWGGPVAFALAAAHQPAIKTLTILDVTLPGIGPDISQGGKRWHHAFHMTPDLPEALIQGRERVYLSWFLRAFSFRQDAISHEDIDEYVRAYSQPGALRAGFSYYRNIPRNVAANKALLDSGLRLKMPVLALGGEKAESHGRGGEPAESLKLIADDVTGGAIPDCGHCIPEEQPRELARRLREFFARSSS